LKSGDGEADLFHVSLTSLSPQALAGLCRDSLAHLAMRALKPVA
jgi:hypothetical protein